MRLILLLVFAAVPLLELAILIKVGGLIGFWPTLLIVILTAVLGTTVLRLQGLGVLRRASDAMAAGKPPIEPVVDGVFLLLAGAFLLAPGLITDALGLVLLIPPVRRVIARWGFDRLMNTGNVYVDIFGTSEPEKRPNRPPTGGDRVIEGEFERLDEKTVDPRRRGPPDDRSTG